MPSGDSSVTEVWNETGLIKSVVLTVLFDSGDGSFAATALTKGKLDGYLLSMTTNPGATAPTDNYDITLLDSNAIDALVTTGANRHTTTTQNVVIPYGTYFHFPVTQDETYTLTIANNSVNSAGTVITLYYSAASG